MMNDQASLGSEPTPAWTEIEVSFPGTQGTIFGRLCLPSHAGPHPALALLHGSNRGHGDIDLFLKVSRYLAGEGIAVLRYDSPGSGKSEGNAHIQSMDERAEEAVKAVRYLSSRSEAKRDAVGLWGISQGGWVCQMAAARSSDVAFIVPVSGPAVSPEEQELHRVATESRAGGLTEADIEKALLMRRLATEVLRDTPIYTDLNRAQVDRLGDGPWTELIDFIKGRSQFDPRDTIDTLLRVFGAIREEPWARFLHIDLVLQQIKDLTPAQMEVFRTSMLDLLGFDPERYMQRVRCPVLAIMGEDDPVFPVQKSARLYQEYLARAGNNDFAVKIYPSADHRIALPNSEFAPGFLDDMAGWLRKRFAPRIA